MSSCSTRTCQHPQTPRETAARKSAKHTPFKSTPTSICPGEIQLIRTPVPTTVVRTVPRQIFRVYGLFTFQHYHPSSYDSQRGMGTHRIARAPTALSYETFSQRHHQTSKSPSLNCTSPTPQDNAPPYVLAVLLTTMILPYFWSLGAALG